MNSLPFFIFLALSFRLYLPGFLSTRLSDDVRQPGSVVCLSVIDLPDICLPSPGSGSLAFGNMRGNGVHQGRRQTIVGFQAKFLQAAAHFVHFGGISALFNDGRNECGEFRSAPARLAGQFCVHEIQPVKRVTIIFDTAKHMHAAVPAGMALNGGIRIYHMQLVAIGGYADIVLAYHCNERKPGTGRFPAFAAAANVIMGSLRRNFYFNWIARAFAFERTAGKICCTLPDTVID